MQVQDALWRIARFLPLTLAGEDRGGGFLQIHEGEPHGKYRNPCVQVLSPFAQSRNGETDVERSLVIDTTRGDDVESGEPLAGASRCSAQRNRPRAGAPPGRTFTCRRPIAAHDLCQRLVTGIPHRGNPRRGAGCRSHAGRRVARDGYRRVERSHDG